MKVLLIGNGAREHCIAEALTKSGRVQLIAYAKALNPGIHALAHEYVVGSLSDFAEIQKCALRVKPDFAVIGPDDPIGAGLADALLEVEVHSVAPLKTVARLESSKSFTRDLMKKYNIQGNPKFKVFYKEESGMKNLESGIKNFCSELRGEYVVKADGLMGGKGVKVSGEHLATIEEGTAFALECIEKFGRVVVEEKLIGQEFSLMSFCDGTTVVDMIPVQDHKRAFEGDCGPNTGGMGSYSCADGLLPFLTKRDIQAAHEITAKVAAALFKETGSLFKGVMYGGFMAVADGVRLIEYNARFGDPEVMNVLPIMKTDFVEVCEAILGGRLHSLKLEFEPLATVCKYVVPEGYPDHPRAGERIVVRCCHGEPVEPPFDGAQGDMRMYYASVDQKPDGLYLSTSRAVAFVGIGKNIDEAEALAEEACARVQGPVFHRRDIGTAALIQKRVEVMKRLRKGSTGNRTMSS